MLVINPTAQFILNGQSPTSANNTLLFSGGGAKTTGSMCGCNCTPPVIPAIPPNGFTAVPIGSFPGSPIVPIEDQDSQQLMIYTPMDNASRIIDLSRTLPPGTIIY